jgi:hypothetical protein
MHPTGMIELTGQHKRENLEFEYENSFMDNEVNLSQVLGLKPLFLMPAGDQKEHHIPFVKTIAIPFSSKPHHESRSFVENACDDS